MNNVEGGNFSAFAFDSPAAERERYRMRTADTEKGRSYSSIDSERINSPGLLAGKG
jgi:hypothetical protein